MNTDMNGSCLVHGGTIYTMEEARPVAEAVLIKDGRIAYVGDLAVARRAASSKTESIDLQGRTALPGFVESHTHPFALGRTLEQVDCRELRSVEEIIQALRRRASSTPKGQWVLGSTYDDTLLKEQRHPTRHDLDRVSNDHPILLVHISVHSAVANSAALQLAGIDRHSPDPDDGWLERDATGEPNGVLWEWAQNLVSRHLPAQSSEDFRRQLASAARRYLAAGVTSAAEAALGLAGGGTLEADAVADAGHSPWLPMRLNVAITYPLWRELRDGAGPGLNWTGDTRRAKARAVKLFQDGSIQLRTAALSCAYHGRAETADQHLIWPQERLNGMVREIHDAGYQIWTHANGDGALDSILKAYGHIVDDDRQGNFRHRVEHCQVAREDQLDRMAELGIAASFFTAHVCYWGDRHRDIFLGPERASRIDPVASALRRGIGAGLHNDTPVTPINPLLSIGTAVSRLTSSGRLLGPDQAISVQQAIKAMTLDSAWLAFEESEKGSLVEGKLGDLVVLDADPHFVAPQRIKDITVTATIVGGCPVYSAI